MSAAKNVIAILTEPGRAMQAVLERSMILLPLLLMMVGNALLLYWYYSTVDFAWLQDRLLSANPELDAAAREVARGFMTKNIMLGSAVAFALIALPVMLALFAVYYLLAAKVIGSDLGYGKWFAFVTWVSVPGLLKLPAAAVAIVMTSNGQLAPEAMNPLSFNQLMFHLAMGHPWQGLLDAIDLTALWSAVVGVIGYQVWTKKSGMTAALVVLLPYAVIYGGWAAYAAMKAAAA
jgi:hypothetical protein